MKKAIMIVMMICFTGWMNSNGDIVEQLRPEVPGQGITDNGPLINKGEKPCTK